MPLVDKIIAGVALIMGTGLIGLIIWCSISFDPWFLVFLFLAVPLCGMFVMFLLEDI